MAETLSRRSVYLAHPLQNAATDFVPGRDLKGYTYWEFKDTNDATRLRRIVKYPRSVPLSEVKVTAQWHQWLRYMREQPPTIEEQVQEVTRQERMKILAAQADARWEAKARVMEAPAQHAQPIPAPDTSKTHADAPAATGANGSQEGSIQQPTTEPSDAVKKEFGHDPWAKPRGGPSEEWQPEAWTPPSGKRR